MLLRWSRKRPSRFRPGMRRGTRLSRAALVPAILLTFLGIWVFDAGALNQAFLRLTAASIESVNPAHLSVVDGDTVRLAGKTIRLTGFDAPETYRARCASERAQGEAATTRLQQLIDRATAAKLYYSRSDEKYGRGLAQLTLDGRDVAKIMIGEGLSRPCSGGQRESWC